MNQELERKFNITNVRSIKLKIKKIGARFLNISESKDIYFKVPQKIKSTKYLRIRTKDNNLNGTLAYHEVLNDYNTKEWEVDISDAKTTKAVIEKLGFEMDVIIQKTREKYQFDKIEILIDQVKNLGAFIEIEAPTIKSLKDTIILLELDQKDIISGSGYPDLLKEKCAKH